MPGAVEYHGNQTRTCPQGAYKPEQIFYKFTVNSNLNYQVYKMIICYLCVGDDTIGNPHPSSRPAPGQVGFIWSILGKDGIFFKILRSSSVHRQPGDWIVTWAETFPYASCKPWLPRQLGQRTLFSYPGIGLLFQGLGEDQTLSLLTMSTWFWGQLVHNFQIMWTLYVYLLKTLFS